MPTSPGKPGGDVTSPEIAEDRRSDRSNGEEDPSLLMSDGAQHPQFDNGNVKSPSDIVSPCSDIEDSSLLCEIVKTLERTNPALSPVLNIKRSPDKRKERSGLRIPLEGVTFVDLPKSNVNGKVKSPSDSKGKSTPGGSAKTPPSITSAKTPSDGSRTPGKATVKPFTKESLERLETKTVQLVKEYGFQPRRKLSVEDGARLPYKYEPFPPKLYGRPLEEIDNFIYDEVSGPPSSSSLSTTSRLPLLAVRGN